MPTKPPRPSLPDTPFFQVRPGDWVFVNGLDPRPHPDSAAKPLSGRAVIVNFLRDPTDHTIVLNMGGRHGTPFVCTPKTFIRFRPKTHRKPSAPAV